MEIEYHAASTDSEIEIVQAPVINVPLVKWNPQPYPSSVFNSLKSNKDRFASKTKCTWYLIDLMTRELNEEEFVVQLYWNP